MRYEDFIVELGPETAEGIQVRARCLLQGEESGWLQLPAPPRAIAERFAEMAAEEAGVPERHVAVEPSAPSSVLAGWGAEEIGSALFDAVFSGKVRNLWERCHGAVGHGDLQGLRLKIKLDLGDPVQVGLHGLPWELLYQAHAGDYLALIRETPVVRYLALSRPVSSPESPEALRVLAVAAEPRGLPPLHVAEELEALVDLGRSVSRLEVDPVKPATLGALRSKLVERKPHVVHFMGHGQVEPVSGRGLLAFEGPDGELDGVSADSLASVLKGSPSLRLVVLNACETARAGAGGADGAYAGLAPALVRGGLSAVLAMQLPVSDAGAIAFSGEFYRRLVAGDPVDVAATEGRKELHSGRRSSVEWAVPALFLRVPDGALFQLRKSRSERVLEDCGWSAALLEAGSYDEAISELRKGLSDAPERGHLRVALAIALARGRSLRRLTFRTAQEMHQELGRALSAEDGQALAASALLALKADYYQPSAVREPPPTSAELHLLLKEAPLTDAESRLLACLELGKPARRALEEAGIDGGMT